jgi:hypothetical protein
MLAAALSAWLGWIGFDSFLAVFPLAAVSRVAYPGLLFLGGREQRPLAFSRQKTFGLLSEASWMFAVEIVAVAYFRGDIFMLSKMVDLRSTGLYLTAYKISIFLSPCFPAISSPSFGHVPEGESDKPVHVGSGAGVVFLCFSCRSFCYARTSCAFSSRNTSKPPRFWPVSCSPCRGLLKLHAGQFCCGRSQGTYTLPPALPMLAINVGLNLGLVPVFAFSARRWPPWRVKYCLVLRLSWPFNRLDEKRLSSQRRWAMSHEKPKCIFSVYYCAAGWFVLLCVVFI